LSGTAGSYGAADILTEFKYGSIGTEGTVGVPYWIWRVLPEVFPDKMPNRPGTGYERLGFTYETLQNDLPIATTKTRGLIPRMGLNCATCHVGTYRDAAFPAARLNAALAGAGKPVYQQQCARGHDIGQPQVGQTIDIADVATDPERLQSFTPELAVQMNTIGTGRPWRFSHFRKTNGYAAMPLDGIWLRAPYLHNGSVPTLRALLFLDERPARFFRAYDVYDWHAVGFVSTGAEAEGQGVAFDTSLRGNDNGGHTYGRELSSADREALLEYLKTL
jgi:hypothetical protein